MASLALHVVDGPWLGVFVCRLAVTKGNRQMPPVHRDLPCQLGADTPRLLAEHTRVCQAQPELLKVVSVEQIAKA